jgi:hypothetical protein
MGSKKLERFMVALTVVALCACENQKTRLAVCTTLVKQEQLEDALGVCDEVAKQASDPEVIAAAKEAILKIESAKRAAEAKANAVPSTVSEPWCDRLGARLYQQYLGDARLDDSKKKYSRRAPDGYLEQVIGDHTTNVVVNCKDDAGQPTAGRWLCLWNSDFNNYKECK